MSFKLTDVKGWHTGVTCIPTMLAAISGKTPAEILEVLKEAAVQRGETISDDLLPEYNIKLLLRAISVMDGNWVEAEPDLPNRCFSERPTINEYMTSSTGIDLEVIFCDAPDKPTHVFARVRNRIVDTHSDGRVIEFTKVPPAYEDFRVKHIFLVWNGP